MKNTGTNLSTSSVEGPLTSLHYQVESGYKNKYILIMFYKNESSRFKSVNSECETKTQSSNEWADQIDYRPQRDRPGGGDAGIGKTTLFVSEKAG